MHNWLGFKKRENQSASSPKTQRKPSFWSLKDWLAFKKYLFNHYNALYFKNQKGKISQQKCLYETSNTNLKLKSQIKIWILGYISELFLYGPGTKCFLKSQKMSFCLQWFSWDQLDIRPGCNVLVKKCSLKKAKLHRNIMNSCHFQKKNYFMQTNWKSWRELFESF